ncbi:MAG: response regulator [Saccharofermentanales bacterium]
MQTILIVDDLQVNRFILKQLIEYDINIIESDNGKNAIDVVKNNNVDLIFMDINMPIMDGVESSKYIRNNINSNININIVAVTAYSLYDISDSSVFDDILNKPINKNILNDLIKKYLKF